MNEPTDHTTNDMQLSQSGTEFWTAVDCGDACTGWVLTNMDTWVQCQGCNSRGTVPHPEADDVVALFYVVTVNDKLVFRSESRTAAADVARDHRDAGRAVRLRRIAHHNHVAPTAQRG